MIRHLPGLRHLQESLEATSILGYITKMIDNVMVGGSSRIDPFRQQRL